MSERGHGTFAGELAGFAAGHADPRLAAIAERAAAPLRVAVTGRRGVGVRTVARALRLAVPDLSVTPQGHDAPDTPDGSHAPDVVVYVTAEVLKPEDLAAVAAAPRVVALLNKADLVGSLSGGDGPLAAARRRCAELSGATGVTLEPIAGLLAVAALEGLERDCWAALRSLAKHPDGAACLGGSHAEFLHAPGPVPADRRIRLLAALDLFGVAIGAAALRRDRTPAQVRALLRHLSGVDAVVRRVRSAGAVVRYGRALDAVADLEALAVADARVGAFLSRDDTVLARMADALAVAEAAGLDPGPAPDLRDDPGGHLTRAARWRRHGLGRLDPASELHRACGADIARGSLRLWSRARGPLGECW